MASEVIAVPQRRLMLEGQNQVLAEAKHQGAATLARRWASERDRVLCNAELDAATDRSPRRINCDEFVEKQLTLSRPDPYDPA